VSAYNRGCMWHVSAPHRPCIGHRTGYSLREMPDLADLHQPISRGFLHTATSGAAPGFFLRALRKEAFKNPAWHPGELYPRVGFIVTYMSRPAERVVAFYNKRGTCAKVVSHGRYMLSSRWPRSPSHGQCSKRYCGSSRSYGRSHHQRQRETFDGHAFKSNRQKECVQMPGKMARSDPRPSVRVTRGAGSGQHLASVLQEAGKKH